MFRFKSRQFNCWEKNPCTHWTGDHVSLRSAPNSLERKTNPLLLPVNERFVGWPAHSEVAIPTAPPWLRFRKAVQTVFKTDDSYRCMQHAWSETLPYNKQPNVRPFCRGDSVGSWNSEVKYNKRKIYITNLLTRCHSRGNRRWQCHVISGCFCTDKSDKRLNKRLAYKDVALHFRCQLPRVLCVCMRACRSYRCRCGARD